MTGREEIDRERQRRRERETEIERGPAALAIYGSVYENVVALIIYNEEDYDATAPDRRSVTYLQREATMARFATTTPLADVWIILAQCLVLQYLQLGVQSEIQWGYPVSNRRSFSSSTISITF